MKNTMTTTKGTKDTTKTATKATAKAKKQSFSTGYVPASRRDITLEYMFDFCKQDKAKAQWFIDVMKKYDSAEGKKQGKFGRIREEFAATYFPALNEKKPTYRSKATKFSAKMEGVLNSFIATESVTVDEVIDTVTDTEDAVDTVESTESASDSIDTEVAEG